MRHAVDKEIREKIEGSWITATAGMVAWLLACLFAHVLLMLNATKHIPELDFQLVLNSLWFGVLNKVIQTNKSTYCFKSSSSRPQIVVNFDVCFESKSECHDFMVLHIALQCIYALDTCSHPRSDTKDDISRVRFKQSSTDFNSLPRWSVECSM